MTNGSNEQAAAVPAYEFGGPDEVMIFIRREGFYPIQGVRGLDLRKQAEDHALLNPGTLRVEDVKGNVLWRLQ